MGMTVSICGLEWLEAATISAVQEGANHPVTNLLDDHPSDVWRSTNLAQKIQCTVDAGSAKTASMFGLLYTNASEDATIRWRMAQTVGELDTNPALDTSQGFGSMLRLKGTDSATVPANAGRLISGSYTIELKIRPIAHRQMGILRYNGGTRTCMIIMRPTGELQWYSDPGVENTVQTLLPLALNEWSHISCVFDAGTDISTLYLNGLVQATAGPLAGGIHCDGDEIELSPVVGEKFIGDIDEFRVWDAARNAGEIVFTMQRELLSGEYSAMLGYYRFNEEVGSTFDDDANTLSDGVLGATNRYGYLHNLSLESGLDKWGFRHAYLFHDVGATARFLRIDVIDVDNPAMEFNAGIVVAGAAWQPRRGWRIGSIPMGFEDQSTITRASGGQDFIRRRPINRRFRLAIRTEDIDEWWTRAYDINYMRGGSRPVLVCADNDSAYLQKNLIYGLMNKVNEVSNPALNVYEQTFNITELL
jgi:hypothetical protein